MRGVKGVGMKAHKEKNEQRSGWTEASVFFEDTSTYP